MARKTTEFRRGQFETLADLKRAYDSGVLLRDCPLILDNDCSSVHADNADGTDTVKVFDGEGPEELLCEALDLLGIPWENC